MDSHHNVTGYFDGVVQVLERPLLAGYLEQSIALGFMGKTPIIHAEMDGETRLCASMPVMDAQSRVLGVVLLDATLRFSFSVLNTPEEIDYAIEALKELLPVLRRYKRG